MDENWSIASALYQVQNAERWGDLHSDKTRSAAHFLFREINTDLLKAQDIAIELLNAITPGLEIEEDDSDG